MTIEKFTKQKNGMYKLEFKNKESIVLHEDLILKYGLLLSHNLDEEMFDKLCEENNYYISYDIALKYITRKMRSSFEVEKYLKDKDLSSYNISKTIALLTKQGYINDEVYCKAFINDKIILSNDGPYKIMKELNNLLISNNLIDENIKLFDVEKQREKINKLIAKQIKSNHNKGSFVMKQKIINYLINLGYDREIIMKELNKVEFDDKKLYKNEYDKLYKQLSKKYSGNELEYKIKQKLFQKGFNNF